MKNLILTTLTLGVLCVAAADAPPKEKFEGMSLDDLRARMEAMEAAEKAKTAKATVPPKVKAAVPKPKAAKPADEPASKVRTVETIIELLAFPKTPDTKELLNNFAALSQGQLDGADDEAKAEYVLSHLRVFVFNNFVNGSAAADALAAERKRAEAAAKMGVELQPPLKE
jgi:hypothetical protein